MWGVTTKLGVELSNAELLLVACTHRYSYLSSPITSPIRQSLATKGALCADVALRKYFLYSYPNMAPHVMSQASKWFLSDLALARYATFLQLKDVIQFDQPKVVYDSISKPEKVTLLASTLKCLFGVVYEDKGTSGVDKVISQQISWVEGLNITDKKEESAHSQIKHTSFPQPKSEPLPNWLSHTLKLTLPGTPKTALSDFFMKHNLGEPHYKTLQEVGRYTSEPLFYVGVFDTDAKLVGTGISSSESEAQVLAARNALTNLYKQKRGQ